MGPKSTDMKRKDGKMRRRGDDKNQLSTFTNSKHSNVIFTEMKVESEFDSSKNYKYQNFQRNKILFFEVARKKCKSQEQKERKAKTNAMAKIIKSSLFLSP